MRPRPRLCLLLLGLLACGCGEGNRPCNECPDLAGDWRVELGQAPLPEACAGVSLPQGLLGLRQVGSALSATWEHLELSGTLFESYDFSLRAEAPADQGPVTHALSGRYAPGRAALETHDLLTGTYTSTWPGRDGCVVSRSYQARRAP